MNFDVHPNVRTRGTPAALAASPHHLLPRALASLVIGLASLPAPTPLFAQASFSGLGYFGAYESRATDVSADGRVVVGFSDPNMFRCTRDGSIVRPVLQQGRPSVSADGSAVAGIVLTPENSFEAFRWVVGESFTPLGDFPGGRPYPLSRAFDISADGRTVVGHGDSGAGEIAFRWTREGGMAALGDFPGGETSSHAHGVSADGSVVVGYGTAIGGHRAFRWTSESGLQVVSSLRSEATAVSADGRVVVGFNDVGSSPGLSKAAFRWAAGSGLQLLGDLPGGSISSIAYDVSADGSVVVGASDTRRDDGNTASGAFYWRADLGMVSLLDLLVQNGATNLAGWRLTEARGVTADGRTIVGTGFHDGRIEAFIATVPEPSAIGLIVAAAALCLLIAARRRHSNVGLNFLSATNREIAGPAGSDP
jgi:probable HAF family extracellular repeat protein